MWTGEGKDPSREQSRVPRDPQGRQLTFDRGAKATQWRKGLFLTTGAGTADARVQEVSLDTNFHLKLSSSGTDLHAGPRAWPGVMMAQLPPKTCF